VELDTFYTSHFSVGYIRAASF